MNWPWSKPRDFGDLFEEQVTRAIEIKAEVVFSGTVSEANQVIGLELDLSDIPEDRTLFIIERSCKADGRTDQHLFIPSTTEMGEVVIEWQHWTPKFRDGKPLFISKLSNEKSANELTRILGKHWDFSRHL